MKQTQIDFKFARNWRLFLKWYKSTKKSTKSGAAWEAQKLFIANTFESTIPNIVDWKQLWADFGDWWIEVCHRDGDISWDSTRRQIETLMLNQLKSLNEKNYVLAFLDKGRPSIDPEPMTYWEALKVKKELEGDANGLGGSENVDRITILNLKKLIQ